jgi:hypothetical protein
MAKVRVLKVEAIMNLYEHNMIHCNQYEVVNEINNSIGKWYIVLDESGLTQTVNASYVKEVEWE